MGYIKILNNSVVSYSDTKLSDEYIETNETYVFGDDNKLYPESYLTSAEYLEKMAKYKNDKNLYAIRLCRKTECFPIINRGELWYNKLTEEQKSELASWYQAWLDAPQTLVVPQKPEWLK